MNIPIVSTVISAISDKLRSVKVTTLGKLTRTATEATPFGVDSNPVSGMQAVFLDTVNANNPVIAGYFNLNALAKPGETRLYWTDADGNEQGRIWGHNDGSVEVGGTGAAGSNTNHAVQYEALNTQLQNEVNLINVELGKIAAAINAIVPGSYTPTNITLNISTAKLAKILVP